MATTAVNVLAVVKFTAYLSAILVISCRLIENYECSALFGEHWAFFGANERFSPAFFKLATKCGSCRWRWDLRNMGMRDTKALNFGIGIS